MGCGDDVRRTGSATRSTKPLRSSSREPPRAERPVDAERLERTLETTDRTLASTGRTMGHRDKARAVAAVHGLIGEGRGQVYTRRVVSLIEAVARGRPVHRSAAPER